MNSKREMKIRKIVFICLTFLLSAGCSVGFFSSWPQFVLDYFLNRKSEPVEPSHYHCGLADFNDCNHNRLVAEKFSKTDAPPTEYKGTSISLKYKQRLPVNSDVKREAVAALHVALELQTQGKTEKAMKVFQHAVALDPSHADILTAYGEFLERHVKDVVKADHLYKIALEHCPDHGRALRNRKRTEPIVEEIDQVRFSRVDRKRAYLYTVPHNNPALRRAKREAYFAHIYHTNAIEGNTLTLSQTRSIVETRMAVGGKSLREQNEVLGLDSALSYINSTLVGHIGKLTLRNILDIHLRVLGYVDPTEAGRFRNTQVYVGDFIPPPASELQEHMDQLVEWLNSDEAQSLHPIEFAALAHYRLVAIHPFFDGNGRTSRLLMNLILMQAGFPPVSIEVHDRLLYYETLEQANNGDIRPFIRFIAECTERTLDEYISVIVEDDSELSLPHSIKQRRSSASKDRVIYIELDDEVDESRGDVSMDGGMKCHKKDRDIDSDKCDFPSESSSIPPYS